MRYIIMCGGEYPHLKIPKWLYKINGEPLIERTIRLLREAGVEDIAISSNHDIFDYLGVPVLKHENSYEYDHRETYWLDAFYPMTEPVCYIFGDVCFSPAAIKAIVDYETDDVMFFASGLDDFSPDYMKRWAEPFAFKVVNTKYFFQAIDIAKSYDREGKWNRMPVSWELWQVLQQTPLNEIKYNYFSINDYTCDLDEEEDLEIMQAIMDKYEGDPPQAKRSVKLSIIIPYYNAEEYINDLLYCLYRQVNSEVEVIIVDDGSKPAYVTPHSWPTVIRQKNQGAGAARNKGIEKSHGEYIAFIDADDLVADDYIDQVFEKIRQGFDVCDLSWKSMTAAGAQFDYKLWSDNDHLSNPSVCTRVFKRSFIGSTRFSTEKDAAEDEDFSRRAGYLDREYMADKVHVSIPDYMYFYRTTAENSNVKQFKLGLRKTKRVVYYYDHFRSDMVDEFEQIKTDDRYNEVWLLTNKCDMPEVKRYAQVSQPFRLWTHFLKGEPYYDVEIIDIPYQTQVVLYINQLNIIGGIETFILHFVKIMSEYYDIALVVGNAPESYLAKVRQYIKVIKYNTSTQVVCDTLIMLRILDTKPSNIICKKSVQMCHACKTNPEWHIAQDCDYVVTVSDASRRSFEDEARKALVINNLIDVKPKKSLLLMSATRMPAPDKGNYEVRMRRLCAMLHEVDIPFIWLNFSEGQMREAPIGFYNLGMTDNVQNFMQKADYVVQLSDSEAFSYTLLEALTINKPVIVTPFESTKDMGIEDGVNGYIVPFDMDFDVKRLLDVPSFTYEYDVNKIVGQWRKILGKTKPKHDYKPDDTVPVTVISRYMDIELGRALEVGERVPMRMDRAQHLAELHLVTI